MSQTEVKRLFDRMWMSQIRKVASLSAQALSRSTTSRGVRHASPELALHECFEGGKVRLSASTTHLGRAYNMIIRKVQAAVDRGTEEHEQEYGARESVHLSEEGGLTQFVAHIQTLQPGSRSSDRHWHEEEDELLYMLS